LALLLRTCGSLGTLALEETSASQILTLQLHHLLLTQSHFLEHILQLAHPILVARLQAIPLELLHLEESHYFRLLKLLRVELDHVLVLRLQI
jgi:hypothetical protein